MPKHKIKYDNTYRLEEEVDRLLTELGALQPESEEYQTVSKQLETLYKLRPIKRAERVPVETWMAVAGNLAGIAAIIVFERSNVLTSKALGFVLKSKA